MLVCYFNLLIFILFFLDLNVYNVHFPLSKSFVAAGQLVEKLLVELVAFFTTAR